MNRDWCVLLEIPSVTLATLSGNPYDINNKG